jgi:hypothetical protein
LPKCSPIRISVASVLIGGLVGCVSIAGAQESSSLHWVRLPGAESCVGGHDLAQAVEDELGHAVLVSAADADLSVEGRVAPRDGGGFTATLAVSDRDGTRLGERSLDSEDPDCAAFTPALAVVIALLIDPDGESERGTEEVAPPAPAQVHDEAWHLILEGGTGIAVGLAENPLWTLAGSVIVETPWLVAFEIGGRLATIGGSGGTDLVVAMGRLAACFVPRLDSRFHLHLCGGIETGVAFVSPNGAEASEHLLVNGAVHARGSIDLVGPLEIWLVPSFVVPFRHDLPAPAEPFAIAFVAELGFGLRF